MTIADALRESGLESLDAELLAAYACGRDRTWIIAHSDDVFDEECRKIFQQLTAQRKSREPVAYILGQKEFYGRMFRVTPDTLIPRPATEGLVQAAFHGLTENYIPHIQEVDSDIVIWSHCAPDLSDVKLIIDFGTGSGCIAVTLALMLPNLHVIATDISEAAVDIARENAKAYGLQNRIIFCHCSSLERAKPITRPFLLVSNPPYIPDSAILDRDVSEFEPHAALFAGKEGTDVLYPLIKEALAHPFCRGFVVECRKDQVTSLPPIATSSAA